MALPQRAVHSSSKPAERLIELDDGPGSALLGRLSGELGGREILQCKTRRIEKSELAAVGAPRCSACDHLADRPRMLLVCELSGCPCVLAFTQAAGLGPVVDDH